MFTKQQILRAAESLAGGPEYFWEYPNNSDDRDRYYEEADKALKAAGLSSEYEYCVETIDERSGLIRASEPMDLETASVIMKWDEQYFKRVLKRRVRAGEWETV